MSQLINVGCGALGYLIQLCLLALLGSRPFKCRIGSEGPNGRLLSGHVTCEWRRTEEDETPKVNRMESQRNDDNGVREGRKKEEGKQEGQGGRKKGGGQQLSVPPAIYHVSVLGYAPNRAYTVSALHSIHHTP